MLHLSAMQLNRKYIKTMFSTFLKLEVGILGGKWREAESISADYGSLVELISLFDWEEQKKYA